MTVDTATIPEAVRADVEALWRFLRIDDDLEPVDVAIGLGCHDPGVAVYTAELFLRGVCPLIVFTGANAPTTIGRFPRGEAVHFREIAVEHGVPEQAILVEPAAKHTADNIDFSRDLLRDQGVQVGSVLITCRPYHQRRAYATAAKRWPGVEIRCSADRRPLHAYTAGIGDATLVIDMLVGEAQRLTRYAELGHTINQDVPGEITAAYHRLAAAGYTSRLLP
ncbi:YdcF family protein [Amycolatopsis albispora]|uniref:DUF218 domain-containing protein n=1 Tax=Amycolatopsis albispora TaxID=1804986 RepID=A0A344LAB7_9PSEU|nr:YdcF family protein [Amycolatopsis albispora]AXB44991.1 hypothetical protein A4R43_22880 [Amycolatopsis albispora]